MSTGEEENDAGWAQGSKKRKIQRACDICRRKKIRCDGGQMPRNRCSNCISYRLNCTYVEAAKKRGPPKGYVEGLENRLDRMGKLLARLAPDVDLSKELDNCETGPRSPDRAASAGSSSVMPSSFASDMATNAIRGVGSSPLDDYPSDDDDLEQKKLTDRIKQLAIDPLHHRFFGKSSGVTLIQTAMDLKKEVTGSDYNAKVTHPPSTKRPEFWDVRPWELSGTRVPESTYDFPDRDLMASLFNLYFKQVNVFYPLLHRPTFEKAVEKGEHLREGLFGSTVLLVCAVGSLYSDDPRVFLDGTDSAHSCGWKWFSQVQVVKKSLLAPPSLYDLQFFSLSVMFLERSSAPQACWTMVGIGIRLAQDVGAHRRKVYNHQLTVEDELWKRAFWVLICMDRLVSTALGRPCAIQDEDFDLELPIECDDEYWEHPDPAMAFKQPPGKPSVCAFFNCYLKLNQVLAFSLRTIYSINKSKILLGFVGQQWEQHIVAELDSALNKWIDSIPDHLRWDPNREDHLFFSQSVSLYASYYHLQILIHRPFIPSPRNPSPLSFPSLAICTNAARSCSHVVEIHRKRGLRALSHVQLSVFTAGIVLLLNIWGGKRSGLSIDPAKEMADVHKCMAVLKECEERSHSAGRLWDILWELASIGDLPLPQMTPTRTNKRERDSDEPISVTPTSSTTLSSSGTPSVPDGPRPMAGSRRVSSAKDVTLLPAQQRQRQQQEPAKKDLLSSFTLPMRSNELSRPFHGQVDSTPVAPADYWYPVDHVSASDRNPSCPPQGMGMPATHVRMQDVTVPDLFSMDQMYYNQMATDFSFGGQVPTPSSTAPTSGREQYQAPYLQDVRTQQTPHSMVDPLHVMLPPTPQSSGPTHAGSEQTVDYDTISMWTNAPTGFELDDWGAYISNVSELAHLHGMDDASGTDVG